MIYDIFMFQKFDKITKSEIFFQYLRWTEISDKLSFQRYIILGNDLPLSKIIGRGREILYKIKFLKSNPYKSDF